MCDPRVNARAPSACAAAAALGPTWILTWLKVWSRARPMRSTIAGGSGWPASAAACSAASAAARAAPPALISDCTVASAALAATRAPPRSGAAALTTSRANRRMDASTGAIVPGKVHWNRARSSRRGPLRRELGGCLLASASMACGAASRGGEDSGSDAASPFLQTCVASPASASGCLGARALRAGSPASAIVRDRFPGDVRPWPPVHPELP